MIGFEIGSRHSETVHVPIVVCDSNIVLLIAGPCVNLNILQGFGKTNYLNG